MTNLIYLSLPPTLSQSAPNPAQSAPNPASVNMSPATDRDPNFS